MPKFTLESTDPAIDTKALEASSWSGAVSKVLGLFKGSDGLVRVDVDKDGRTEVWDEDSDLQMSFDAEGDQGFEVWDVPTTDLWDAPNPGSGAAQVQSANLADQAKAQEQLAKIRSAPTEAEACSVALDLLMQMVPAESGSILLAEGSRLRFTTVRGPKAAALSGESIDIRKGIAGACATSGTALLVRQARGSYQHDPTIDTTIDHLTRTLLALPIATGGQVVGVIELLNPFGTDTFTADQQVLGKAISGHLAERLRKSE